MFILFFIILIHSFHTCVVSRLNTFSRVEDLFSEHGLNLGTQFENSFLTDMCSGSEAGLFLGLTDSGMSSGTCRCSFCACGSNI